MSKNPINTTNKLMAISPIDGRYSDKVEELSVVFSEFSLIKYRILVEIRYFKALANNTKIKEIDIFNKQDNNFLDTIVNDFSIDDAIKVKEIEATTNHDVKAIEYFIKEKIASNKNINNNSEFIHFACTSEDINNLSYGLMLKDARYILLSYMTKLIAQIDSLANKYRHNAILCKTHGQNASPSTMGKEMANVSHRLKRQLKQFSSVEIIAKLNGAVGNFNAHLSAYPEIEWHKFSKNFINNLGLIYTEFSTQIEPHDYIAEYFQTLSRFNTILIDFSRDIWSYISIGYFKQKIIAKEVGSSTMPHKVNPIDFENAEGNLGLANAMAGHFAAKLPVSRLQRDLSDSTVLRSLGVCCAYSLIAYKSLLNGISKLDINQKKLDYELDNSWEILAEPIQTIMRRYGVKNPYEQLKALSRGQKITKESIKNFITNLSIPDNAKKELLKLSPKTYIGCADKFNI